MESSYPTQFKIGLPGLIGCISKGHHKIPKIFLPTFYNRKILYKRYLILNQYSVALFSVKRRLSSYHDEDWTNVDTLPLLPRRATPLLNLPGPAALPGLVNSSGFWMIKSWSAVDTYTKKNSRTFQCILHNVWLHLNRIDFKVISIYYSFIDKENGLNNIHISILYTLKMLLKNNLN